MNKIDSFIYRILRYALLFVPFFPLVFIRNSFSPFNFGKGVASRAFIEIIFPFYLYLILKYPSLRPWKWVKSVRGFFISNPFISVLGLLTISWVVSTFAGVDWRQSLWGTWERMGGLFSWIHYCALFLMLTSLLKTRNDWNSFFWIWASAALASSIYGFLQRTYSETVLGATGRMKILGTAGNPTAFAGYATLSFFISLFLISQTTSKSKKILLFIFSAVFIVATFMTASRGTTLGLVLSSLITGFLYLINRRKTGSRVLNLDTAQRKKIFIGLSIFILLILISTAVISSKTDFKNSLYLKRMLLIRDRSVINYRFLVWGSALKGTLARPVLGWGPENFETVFAKYYNPKIFEQPQDVFYDRAHNFVFDIAATQGFTGLVLWLILLAGVFVFFAKRNIFTLSGLVIAYCIHNFFFFDLLSTYLIIFIIFAFAQKNFLDENVDDSDETSSAGGEPQKSGRLPLVISVGIFVILIAVNFYTNIGPAFANYFSTRSYVLFSRGDGDGGISYATKASKVSFWSKQEVMRKFSEGFIDFMFNNPQYAQKEIAKLQTVGLIDYFKKRLDQNPYGYVNYGYLNKLYRMDSRFYNNSPEMWARSEKILLDAREKFPLLIPIYYELFSYYMEQSQPEKAAQFMSQALSLNDNPFSRARLGVAYLFDGINKNNDSEFKTGFDMILATISKENVDPNCRWILEETCRGPEEDLYNSIGGELKSTKKYSNMADLYKTMAGINKKYYVLVSYSYLLSGDKKNATIFADEALKLDSHTISPAGFKLLSEIYRTLGDNKKRSEAFLKAGWF